MQFLCQSSKKKFKSLPLIRLWHCHLLLLLLKCTWLLKADDKNKNSFLFYKIAKEAIVINEKYRKLKIPIRWVFVPTSIFFYCANCSLKSCIKLTNRWKKKKTSQDWRRRKRREKTASKSRNTMHSFVMKIFMTFSSFLSAHSSSLLMLPCVSLCFSVFLLYFTSWFFMYRIFFISFLRSLFVCPLFRAAGDRLALFWFRFIFTYFWPLNIVSKIF